MASHPQIRQYLAYWFQLGKPVILSYGRSQYLPVPVFEHGSYSRAFEDCWQEILRLEGEGCYVEGTYPTVAMMLSPAWEMQPCARCDMPIFLPAMGISPGPCPCHDLAGWPNNQVPIPRAAVDTRNHLASLHRRLESISS